MAALSAMYQAGRWRVLRRDVPGNEADALAGASADGRAAAWRAAASLGVHSSPWDLEYFKAGLGEPEVVLGLAESLAADCAAALADTPAQPEITLCAPGRYLNPRTVRRVFAARGLPVKGLRWQNWVDRAQFLVASAGACFALLAYLMRYSRCGAPPAARAGILLAVHAEWSNRTRHVLAQLGEHFPAEAIILLGRMRRSPAHVALDWSARLGTGLPPVLVPLSPWSALRAVPRMLALLGQGLRRSSQVPYLPGLREHAAIAFRVLLGAAMQQWWRDSGVSVDTVVYGHTGTADTTMLEDAQRRTGATSIHVVHGVANGPNFLGYSDIAVFRCGHDARLYQGLHQYGRCIAPAAPVPEPRRGASGILLMTNYAHPLNPGYIDRGLADELRVLRDVAAIAKQMGAQAKPLLWRPHPMTSALPQPLQAQLAREAQSLGFEQVAHSATPAHAAAQVRWNLATPSTVTLDLLLEGYLCVVLDWQASQVDTAAAQLPSRAANTAELQDMLNHLQMEHAYQQYFHTAWSLQAPAQALDLGTLTKGLQ